MQRFFLGVEQLAADYGLGKIQKGTADGLLRDVDVAVKGVVDEVSGGVKPDIAAGVDVDG